MDANKNKKIQEQVEKWDTYARLTPTIFLVTSLFLVVLDIVDFESAFYVGLAGFAVTAVVWWWWAIFTIRYLVITLNRASNNLVSIKRDIQEVTAEVEGLKSK